MEFWQWTVLVLGALILLIAVVYGVQARRRAGGIVAQRSRSGRSGRSGGTDRTGGTGGGSSA